MKLLYAGFGTPKPYTQLLFNCTRNPRCQSPFYVPVRDFSDISLYVDLPGKPSLITIDVLNVCDIANEGSAVASKYVVGTKDDGTWYGVFGSLIVTPPVGVVYSRFFFRFTFTKDGNEFVYYSQQYEFPVCEELSLLKSCYPQEPKGTNASDCNGIYYGFPNNDDLLGSSNYYYVHSAYLRMASVFETANKMNFTGFNSKRNYKTVFTREYQLEFELVPAFYKDTIVGVLNRGNVEFEGTMWKLAEEQNISFLGPDSKLWKMDIIFDEQCKQTFGCSTSDCSFPIIPCCDPVVGTPTIEVITECMPAALLSGGSLPDGTVGVPYDRTITYSGTLPFVLSAIIKPSWMTVALVGTGVHLTGTPDVATDGATISFTLSNCEDSEVDFTDEIIVGITPPPPSCTSYQLDGHPSSIIAWEDCITGNPVSDTIVGFRTICALTGTVEILEGPGLIAELGPCE